MRAIIVAAGRSTRLWPLTRNFPKCLLHVGHRTILNRHLETIRSFGIEKITVVSGHCADKIHADGFSTITNPDFATTNNLASFCRALDTLDEETFYFHADIVFDREILHHLLNADGEVCLSVELKRCDEEDMKVKLTGDHIVAVNKHLPIEESAGEFIGIAKFSPAGLAAFKPVADAVLAEDPNAYFARAIEQLAATGFPVNFADTGDGRYVEIDTRDDLRRALDVFKEDNCPGK